MAWFHRRKANGAFKLNSSSLCVFVVYWVLILGWSRVVCWNAFSLLLLLLLLSSSSSLLLLLCCVQTTNESPSTRNRSIGIKHARINCKKQGIPKHKSVFVVSSLHGRDVRGTQSRPCSNQMDWTSWMWKQNRDQLQLFRFGINNATSQLQMAVLLVIIKDCAVF